MTTPNRQETVRLVHVPTFGWRPVDRDRERRAYSLNVKQCMSLVDVAALMSIHPEEADRLVRAYCSQDTIEVSPEAAEVIRRCR